MTLLVHSSTPNTPILKDSLAPPRVPPPTVATSPITVPVTPRHSTHKTKGTLTSKIFQDEIYVPYGAQAYLSTLPVPTQYEIDGSLAYLFDPNTDYDTGIIYCSDTRAFVAKTRRNYDPNNSSYNESMTGTHAQKYRIEIHKEISHIIKQSTWCMIPRNNLHKLPNEKSSVLPRTLAFKIKQLCDGS